MELTEAGEQAVRDRVRVSTVTSGDGSTLNNVAGRYGKGFGVVPGRDTQGNVVPLPSSGLNKDQRTGQEPLPKNVADSVKGYINDAGKDADERGQVVGPAKALTDRMTPGQVASITQRADYIDAQNKQAAAAKDNDTKLRSIYNDKQMASLDKAIFRANKSGGEVYDKGGGNFDVRKKKPMPVAEELRFGTRGL
jgi:hypothetical protein